VKLVGCEMKLFTMGVCILHGLAYQHGKSRRGAAQQLLRVDRAEVVSLEDIPLARWRTYYIGLQA
jgi:hypothetical protein